ncbi:MAG: putative integrase, partial [Nitrosospira multiformis]|nr:putative integrase [Nitrosospira multiformis]
AHFCKTLSTQSGAPLTVIGVDEILNYKAALLTSTLWRLGALSALFRKWHSLGVPGVTESASKLLNDLRLPGMVKGISVLTFDPVSGPLNDLELEAVLAASKEAFDSRRWSLHDYVIVMLFISLGQRPTQYAALKIRDVSRSTAKDGTVLYSLRMPRAKQKGGLAREQFKDRLLHPSLGALVWQYAKETEAVFEGLLDDSADAPLFPAKERRYQEPAGFEFHRTGASISLVLTKIVESLGVTSVRTGSHMNITPYRFRRTTGTRAAVEGHGELVIAELLDHTDTQNVGVYVQAVPEIVERIDRAMAFHLAPLAQAFAGTIISSEADAIRSGDPSSRVCDPRFDPSMKPMGSCGSHGFCGALAPIACYTCRSFQPWLDGPHEAVLDYLIAERERLLAASDVRIASINDRTILAVAEVVARCKELKASATETCHD